MTLQQNIIHNTEANILYIWRVNRRTAVASITDKFAIDSNLVYICIINTRNKAMPRQSISFSKPNDEWLKAQIESEEYSSKSELVNDLIRQARKQHAHIDWIREKLEKSERSGFTNENKEQILKQSKSFLNG
jgi:antitoxin ParD1/3/4